MENTLISPNQSCLKTRDSCINYMLSIVQEICRSFGYDYELRGVFLAICKAVNKVCRSGLLCKLRQNGITGTLLNTLTDFLKYRKQRVGLHDQHSSWADVEAGAPKGSILQSLLFLIYIDNLSDLASNPKLFTDDTSFFSLVKDIDFSGIDLNNEIGIEIGIEKNRNRNFSGK